MLVQCHQHLQKANHMRQHLNDRTLQCHQNKHVTLKEYNELTILCPISRYRYFANPYTVCWMHRSFPSLSQRHSLMIVYYFILVKKVKLKHTERPSSRMTPALRHRAVVNPQARAGQGTPPRAMTPEDTTNSPDSCVETRPVVEHSRSARRPKCSGKACRS